MTCQKINTVINTAIITQEPKSALNVYIKLYFRSLSIFYLVVQVINCEFLKELKATFLIFFRKSNSPFVVFVNFFHLALLNVMLWPIWYQLHNLNIVKTSMKDCLLVLKVTLFHECFSRFLNCANGYKSRKVSQVSPFINTE